MTVALGSDRRDGGDRRTSRFSVRFPERRSGFDQRWPEGGRLRLAYHRALERYRRKPRVLLVVLMAFLSLNVVDLLLTIDALEAGASEANPVMAWLLGLNPLIAAAYKLFVGAAAALVIFALRRYRRVLEASFVLLGSFIALLAYHVFGALVLAG